MGTFLFYNDNMSTTPNGYEVITTIDDCKLYPIKTGLTLPLRPGAHGYVLAYFLKGFDKRVEPLRTDTTFGYAKRPNTNSPDEFSEHAAGTAVDANSTDHPNGRDNTFTDIEEAELRSLLSVFDGFIKWGGDFNGTKDEMHFQLESATDWEIETLARRLKKNNTVSLRRLEPGNRNIDVYMVKRALNARGYEVGPLNYYFSTRLREAYRKWQVAGGNDTPSGLPGRHSLERLGFKVVD
jgi:hypothetical protein